MGKTTASYHKKNFHKENFQNNPTVRLINPAKNKLGKINKFVLDKINKNTRENLKLNQWRYRDDGLAVFKSKRGPQVERIKKYFLKIFRENKLNIVTKCNLKIVDYLDVTLNLVNNTYKPFSKSNNEINYTLGIQPPTVYNQLSTFFNRVIYTPIYQEALNKSAYDYTLKYQKST